ncbi:hypothetical protein [Caballeronia sordidicola]|uniref:hypothetical protein n=1 Tax=Caballeronia sordidicola TaxID=196367 RepID=UPI001269FD9F|nr:hypothetical protein [Caballeronia sordidicola]
MKTEGSTKSSNTNIQIILDGLDLTTKQIETIRTAVQRAVLSELATIDNGEELHIRRITKKSIALDLKLPTGETEGMVIRQKLA